MQKHSYPDFASHKALHQEFTNTYESYKQRFQKDGATKKLCIEVENFLGQWWTQHIGIEDKKYAEFIKNKSQTL